MLKYFELIYEIIQVKRSFMQIAEYKIVVNIFTMTSTLLSFKFN